MVKRIRVESPPLSAPVWMVTYSDMISLLVTFFVMLMSFSTDDDHQAMVVLGAFGANRGGVLEQEMSPSLVHAPRYDRMLAVHAARGAERPHARPAEELLANLAEMGRLQLQDELGVDLTAASDGLLITFADSARFAPGAVEPPAELERSLERLASVLAHYSNSIVVEGHADGAHESASIANARATAAAKWMLASSELAPDAVQIAATSHPAAGGTSAEGRALARRVDVRILALSKSHALALEQRRQEAR